MSIFTFSNNPFEILDTHDAVGIGSGGSLTIDGGASIAQDTFIGGFINAGFNSHTIGSIITTGGNVGIGKLPDYTLDVSGTINSNNLIASAATIGSLNYIIQSRVHIIGSSGSALISIMNNDFIIRSGQNAGRMDTIVNLSSVYSIGNVIECFYQNAGTNSITIVGETGVTINGNNLFEPGSTHKISIIISGPTTCEVIVYP